MIDPLAFPTGLAALVSAARFGFWLARSREKRYKRYWQDALKVIDSKPVIEWIVDERVEESELQMALAFTQAQLQSLQKKEHDRKTYERGLADGQKQRVTPKPWGDVAAISHRLDEIEKYLVTYRRY